MFDPPPTIDPAYYRAGDPALAGLDDAAVVAHYRAHGRAAGRVASPLALRENLLASIGDDRTILEIGPFCRPLKRGPLVRYLDVLDAAQLRMRAERSGIDPAGCPDVIHYVGGLEQVDGRFDVVLSSHAIEHQPDLIGHLREVERVLAPGGAYVLMIPDKRYCFDHFLSESTIAGVLQAYEERRTRHTLASVIEHRALTTHNDSLRHWRGDHGAAESNRAARVRVAIDEYARAAGGYIDVHAWYFTPPSFRSIITTLHEIGLIGLAIGGLYHPAYGRNEFCAILQVPHTE